jgi:tetratricopeptide (TPR) repeat protein
VEVVARRRRRWPFLLLIVLVAGAAYLGMAGGAASATASAAALARSLTASGAYAEAIQLDDAIALRTGPIYVFDRNDVVAAPLDAQRVMLAWAQALDRQGRFDEALAVVDEVASPQLGAAAANERGRILIDAARGDAAKSDYPDAVARLQQLLSGRPPLALSREGAALLAQYQVAEAGILVLRGNGADAVTLLGQVSHEGGGAPALAAQAYPAALLGAGQEELSLDSYKEAAATLQQLVRQYPGSGQAGQAQSMLSDPQPVTGTLVQRGGDPFSGQVRLSSNFTSQAGGYYTTSGPFYYADADASGTFRFDAIPVGGPYVLEVFRDGDWTTYVNPATGQPATPVNVTALVPVNLSFVELP